MHASDGAADQARELLEAVLDLVGALKHRASDREDPATVFLLRHFRAATPLRVSDLACSSRLDVSTVSRHVKQLDDAGLLTRIEDPHDRRVSRLQITDGGRTLLEAAMDARAAALADGMADWPQADRDALSSLLTRLARAVNSTTLHTTAPQVTENR